MVLSLLFEHIFISSTAVILSSIIGIFAGIYISSNKKWIKTAFLISNILITIPSVALFGILISLLSPLDLGTGKFPAIVALVLYGQLPIMRNTYTAMITIDKSVIDSAVGMGMTDMQILFKVKLPISLPMILSGIRITAVMTIGITTIAAFIGAGGLGMLIARGIAEGYIAMIAAGATGASLLAIAADGFFLLLGKLIVSRGITKRKYA